MRGIVACIVLVLLAGCAAHAQQHAESGWEIRKLESSERGNTCLAGHRDENGRYFDFLVSDQNGIDGIILSFYDPSWKLAEGWRSPTSLKVIRNGTVLYQWARPGAVLHAVAADKRQFSTGAVRGEADFAEIIRHLFGGSGDTLIVDAGSIIYRADLSGINTAWRNALDCAAR